jgi:hypothetical protein
LAKPSTAAELQAEKALAALDPAHFAHSCAPACAAVQRGIEALLESLGNLCCEKGLTLDLSLTKGKVRFLKALLRKALTIF